jgi:adenine-specific DNA-methyltransferase
MSIERITKDNELAQSKDLIAENISKLKELFPEAFAEGKIDFTVLRDVLGDEVENEEEYYRFTWAGKAQARREAHKPSTGTLRPCKEESVDWDTTQNLYIEGDNLEVLKLLQKSYANKVKMIYIDPPYNTGNDFVYADNYTDNIKNYQELTGQIDNLGNRLSTNTESDGRYHSNWLNMIYPRLRLARNLLKEDGVIFISIGEDEVSSLQKVGNEIFGEQNFISLIPRIAKRTSNKGTYFKPTKDYILAFARNISKLGQFGTLKEVEDSDYPNQDEKGFYRKNGASLYQPSLDSRPNQRYFIEAPDGTFLIPPGDTFPEIVKDGSLIKPSSNNDKVWRWSRDTYLERKSELIFTQSTQSPLLDENRKQAKWNIYDKVYKHNDLEKIMLPEDVIYDHLNSHGTKELNKLGINFSFSKPSGLVKYLMQVIMEKEKNTIILDFFSGSGTTADAVMQLNAEDNLERKYIQVQLPELIDEKNEAFIDGFRTIAEIGKERIRRAAKTIESQNKLMAGNLDLGFRVFKLDSSNIKGWSGNPDDITSSLFDSQDNLKEDRTEEDVLFEILLKYGLDLTLPIEEKTIEGKRVFNVGQGALFICLGDGITSKVAEAIGAWKEQLNPETCRVIFKDSGFTDVEKTNSVQTLKRFGIHEIKSI